MVRSVPVIAAIAASTSRSPSSLLLFARASAFTSWARALIAAFSSAVNPVDFLVVAIANHLRGNLLCEFDATAVARLMHMSRGFADDFAGEVITPDDPSYD